MIMLFFFLHKNQQVGILIFRFEYNEYTNGFRRTV